jgi:hypothetical protein
MHEDDRSERRRPDERTGKVPGEPLPRHAIARAEAHDEIVRMLIVDQRRPFECLAGLKGLW